MKRSAKDIKLDRKFGTILGIKVDSSSKQALLMRVEEFLSTRIQFYIVTPNPEIILEAQSNSELTRSLNEASISLADGEGLKLADKSLKIIKGRRFMLDLFALANTSKLKVYLLGSTKEVIKNSLEKISKDFPGIKALGDSGPKLDKDANPVSEVDTNLQSVVVKEINDFKPDLLFVAFGAPKQEIWIEKHLKDLKAGGAMAVGGSLDYFSGSVHSVPALFEDLKLEWLWRLILEPRRVGRIFNATIKWPLTVFFRSVKN